MTILKVGVIYKIAYPNGKIYIGQDRTDDINYFGSADSFTIAKDFSLKTRRSMTITKEILWRRGPVSIVELNQLERFFIEQYRSNDPAVGYNRTPGYSRRKCTTVFLEASNVSRQDR